MSEQLSPPPSAGGPPQGAADTTGETGTPGASDPAGAHGAPGDPADDSGIGADGGVSGADQAAVNALRSSVMRLSRRLKHQRVDESLSPTEMSVLGTLARCGSATPSELARKEHVQPPSMTRIVAMLEAKGLVRLEPHPEDRRQKVVNRTEQAESMLAAARTKRSAWLAELFASLDEDERATLRAAAPVLEKLAHL